MKLFNRVFSKASFLYSETTVDIAKQDFNTAAFIVLFVLLNPLPSLTLRSARDLNVPCLPKRSKALLLSSS
jgi:hypothetical protein